MTNLNPPRLVLMCLVCIKQTRLVRLRCDMACKGCLVPALSLGAVLWPDARDTLVGKHLQRLASLPGTELISDACAILVGEHLQRLCLSSLPGIAVGFEVRMNMPAASPDRPVLHVNTAMGNAP